MEAVGIIPARYASTRFPGKPLAMIKGKTMIQRVYEQALKSGLAAVVVATDDVRIADEVMAFGGCYVLTDPKHRSGTERCREALELLDKPYEVVINIQGDEPFIDPRQIDLLVGLMNRADTVLASLAKRIEDEDELFDPNTVKVVMDAEGKALYFSRNPIPFMRNLDRNDWMKEGVFYKHVGIYGYKAEALWRITELPESSLERAESLEQLRWIENGWTIRMGITSSENLSIDQPSDLTKAERFAENQINTKDHENC